MKSKIFEAKIFSIESIPLLFLHIKKKEKKREKKIPRTNFEQKGELGILLKEWKRGPRKDSRSRRG